MTEISSQIFHYIAFEGLNPSLTHKLSIQIESYFYFRKRVLITYDIFPLKEMPRSLNYTFDVIRKSNFQYASLWGHPARDV